jgi:hypothetical protein
MFFFFKSCISFSEQTAIISLHNINYLVQYVFIIVLDCVFCEVYYILYSSSYIGCTSLGGIRRP